MLTLAYLTLAFLGCGYVLVSLFLGDLTDFSQGGEASPGPDHAAESYGLDDSGHGEASASAHGGGAFHFPFFSPLALATLCAAVGGYGLITRHGFELSEGRSLAIAVPSALVTAYAITYLAWRVVRGSRGTSAIRLADLAGAQGEVLTPIPSGGVGEVAALVVGQRFTSPAREESGQELPRGCSVVVVRTAGATLVVKALSPLKGGTSNG
ncbi:MAG TPA: NfeD family protein [Vicinamibacteria bacterium]|nr:NfeD family protein [Vicinamibacteria bacterium]